MICTLRTIGKIRLSREASTTHGVVKYYAFVKDNSILYMYMYVYKEVCSTVYRNSVVF